MTHSSTFVGWVLLAGLGLAGCGLGTAVPAPISTTQAAARPNAAIRPARANVAKVKHPATVDPGPSLAAAPAIRKAFSYVIAVNDALPNSRSMVGFLHLIRDGSTLHGQFRLFYLKRYPSGVLNPQIKTWPVRGSVASGADVKLTFHRASGNPNCLLFACSVSGHLSAAAIDLKTLQAHGALGTVRLRAGNINDYNDRVTAIKAYINGQNEYVAGQQIEAAKWAHGR